MTAERDRLRDLLRRALPYVEGCSRALPGQIRDALEHAMSDTEKILEDRLIDMELERDRLRAALGDAMMTLQHVNLSLSPHAVGTRRTIASALRRGVAALAKLMETDAPGDGREGEK